LRKKTARREVELGTKPLIAKVNRIVSLMTRVTEETTIQRQLKKTARREVELGTSKHATAPFKRKDPKKRSRNPNQLTSLLAT
tara:strand:+ start:410 stop:658 length:249 start_codon:yes stop_codon:yes gene_type:complete